MNSITYDGNFTRPQAIKAPRTEYPIPNFQDLQYLHQDFVQLASKYQPAQLGTPHSDYINFVLVKEENFSNLGGGLLSFTKTFCQVPTRGLIVPTTVSFNKPGYRQQWEVYEGTEQQGSQASENSETFTVWSVASFEDKIIQQPIAQKVAAEEFIVFHNLANLEITNEEISDGVVIQNQVFQDGLSFDDLEIFPAFSPTESQWKKIKESRPPDGQDQKIKNIEILPTFETNFLSPTSTPTWDQYNQMVADGEYLQITPTEIVKVIGPIYKTSNIKIKAI